jgi:peptidoglycan/LPS O-acetylase OafA/YrhL
MSPLSPPLSPPSSPAPADIGGTSRNHGLDLLRALAVTFVVLHHYTLFVSDSDTFGWVGTIGWAGVDLFFALSGYLIGNQIFAALRSPAGLSLPRFYGRRLLRTLPNFYAVLALYVLWPAWRGDPPLLPLWKYLSFTQNIALEPGTAFSHAWSLCIEEQFYLLLPACAMLGAVLARARPGRWQGRGRALVWILLALACAAGAAVRAHVWHDGLQGAGWMHHYYKHIYYATLCRFDELLAGVALAFARQHHPAVWTRLMAHGRSLLAAGIAVTGCAFVLFLRDHYGYAVTLFGYPMLALGFTLLVAAALAGEGFGRVAVPGAGRLALWSYAIYLTHKSVCILVAARLGAAGYGPEAPLTVACALAASVLAGWLLYRVVELPFMAVRSRYLAGNGRPSPGLATVPRQAQ